jgi:hypothetical protein
MSDFVIPGSAAPNNLHFPPHVKATLVEKDVFNICERLAEIDKSLFVIAVEGDRDCAFVIMEHCADGTDRLVWKAKELDARAVEKAEKLRAVPFEHRFKAIADQIDKEEQEQREHDLDELYERLGAPMLRELERTNFIDRKSKTVLPLTNKTAQRHRLPSNLRLD